MSIRIYAGRIRQNTLGMEYVEQYFPVVFPHATHETYDLEESTIKTRATINYMVNTGIGDLDATPTNLITLYRQIYNISDSETDLSSLDNTKINFFSSNNVTDKLPFEMGLFNANSGQFYFGVPQYAMGFRWTLSFNINNNGQFNNLFFISSPKYGGNSFDDILNSAKEEERLYFLNGLYTNYFHLPEFAPFFLFYNENSNAVSLLSIRNEYSLNLNRLYGANIIGYNLSRWQLWYQFLKGRPFYGFPFTLELNSPIKGLDKIELATTFTPYGQYDKGYQWSTTCLYDDIQYIENTNSFSFYNVGTDLDYLFDIDNNTRQRIFLKNGYLERESDNNSSNYVHYKIVLNGEGMDFYTGSSDTSFMRKVDRGFGSGFYGGGRCNFIGVPEKFARSSVIYWLRDVDSNYSRWEWGNAPIGLMTYHCTISERNPIYSPYIDYVSGEDITPQTSLPVLVANLCPYHINVEGCNFITNGLPISYNFWLNFLSGYSEPLPDANIGGGSIGGGTSSTGGGQGGFNDNSSSTGSGGSNDLINGMDDLSFNSGQSYFYHLYWMDNTALTSLGQRFWSTDWTEWLTRAFGNNTNPQDSLIALRAIPFNISKNATLLNGISFGGSSFEVNGEVHAVNNLNYALDFGIINIDEYYGSFVDYEKTEISLVLPFVGIQGLDAREIIGGSIRLQAMADILNGYITYYLTLNKNNVSNCIGSWRGMFAYDYALSNIDMRDKTAAGISTVVNTASGLVGGLVGGNGVIGRLKKGVTQGASELLNGAVSQLSAKSSIHRSGSFAGDRNSISHPYIIIERAKVKVPDNYAALYGYPSNVTQQLKYLSGYTEVGMVHLENMGYATQEEVDEIEELLHNGVIF